MTERASGGDWLRTSVGRSDAESITVRGHDLARDLMGVVSFSDAAFLLAAGRVPSPAESAVFDAVLVSLADHGLTPAALAARLTYTGAPESLQGAVAAGLLGAGSVFLGPVEDAAVFLGRILESVPPDRVRHDDDLRVAAGEAVVSALASKQRIPGLGHPIHSVTDPRVPRLYRLARDNGLYGPHLRLLEMVAGVYSTHSGRTLPINGAGAAGAALADLGFPPRITRGFALLARVAGLVAHLAEEAEAPIGMRLWEELEARASTHEWDGDPPGAGAGR